MTRVNSISEGKLSRKKYIQILVCIACFIVFAYQLSYYNYSKENIFNTEYRQRQCAMITHSNEPATLNYERNEFRNYFYATNGTLYHLPWHLDSEKELDLSNNNIWYTNPSIVEIEDDLYFYTANMIVADGLDCGDLRSASPDIVYACMYINSWKVFEFSIVSGYFRLGVCETSLFPNTLLVQWNNAGYGWGDTRLHPYTSGSTLNGKLKRRNQSSDILPIALVTGMKSDYIYSEDWVDRDYGAFFTVTVMNVAYSTGRMPAAFSRALYYDPVQDKENIKKRMAGDNSVNTFASAIDIAREICTQRPPHLPQIPSYPSSFIDNANVTMWYHKKFYRKAFPRRIVPSVLSRSVGGLHAHPGWKHRDDFVDKNWSPFRFQGRLLWSYTFQPHVVCEMDIDFTAGNISTTIDCLLCVKQYYTSSDRITDKLVATLRSVHQIRNTVHFHLNGVSCYKLRDLPFYIGVVHTISYHDEASHPAYESNRAPTVARKEYHHFFYLMHDYPPFAVADVSSVIPLKRGRAIGSYYKPEEYVVVAFVSGFLYAPDRKGREFVLTYGSADMNAMVLVMSEANVMAMFNDSIIK